MKKKRERRGRIGNGIMCMAAAGIAVACGARAEDWRLAAVDQARTEAVVIEAAPRAAAKIVWRWSAVQDPGIRREDVASFGAIDECKPVDGGATLLVNASRGGVAAIDVASRRAVWYAKATRGDAGPHSPCRLPDGCVAVANSTGCDALEIIEIRRAPLDPARQRIVRAAKVPGAHGVLWDARRRSLFVLGYTNLYEFAYLPETMSVKELRCWRYDGVAGDPYGHDLVPDAKGGCFITNHSGVWRFDPVTGTFVSVLKRRNVKSFSRDSRKGDLLQTARVKWWSDRLIVIDTDGSEREVGPFPGAKFYKARWFVADGRRLAWSDDFADAALDTNRWSRCVKGSSDWNRHMSVRPDLVAVTNGHLVMRGVLNTETNADPRPFLTGGVSSQGKGLFKRGKVEMRVLFQDHQKGAWPALWMCGETPDDLGRGWPWNGEIDIVERLNGDPFVYQTAHSGWTFVKHRRTPVSGGRGAIRNGEWNVYGFECRPDELVWSVNGVETFRYARLAGACDPDQWPFERDFFFYLDMQLSGKWVGEVDLATLPVEMRIDWIRVYE